MSNMDEQRDSFGPIFKVDDPPEKRPSRKPDVSMTGDSLFRASLIVIALFVGGALVVVVVSIANLSGSPGDGLHVEDYEVLQMSLEAGDTTYVASVELVTESLGEPIARQQPQVSVCGWGIKIGGQEPFKYRGRTTSSWSAKVEDARQLITDLPALWALAGLENWSHNGSEYSSAGSPSTFDPVLQSSQYFVDATFHSRTLVIAVSTPCYTMEQLESSRVTR